MATEPTYIVRGYYDTGQRLTINGVARPILQSMVSFGYFVSHEGALTGWSHSLSGAEQLAPDFYRIAVPNNSARKIAIRIEAKEGDPSVPGSGPAGGDSIPWWAWLVLALLLVTLLLWFLRRRATP